MKRVISIIIAVMIVMVGALIGHEIYRLEVARQNEIMSQKLHKVVIDGLIDFNRTSGFSKDYPQNCEEAH